jgi:hypothetical protein
MVKLIFNPKDFTGTSVVGKISKKKEHNLTIEFECPDISSLKLNDTLCSKDIVGLENYLFILNKWYQDPDPLKTFLLVIGPVGCGKTVATELYCKENNISVYSVNNYNKIKKDLIKEIQGFSEFSFFKKNDPKLIIIDEYQNGSNDLLSITDINNLYLAKIGKENTIFKDKINLPMILIISADSRGSKLSDLKKLHQVYYINEINLDIIKSWVNKLLKKEIDIDLIKKCKSDKRLLLNTISFNCSKVGYKDTDVNLFEISNTVFLEKMNIKELFNIYDSDGFLLSNLIYENYLDYSGDIDSIAKAADAISLGETIFSDTYDSVKTFLPDHHCVNSLLLPTFYCNNSYKTNKCQIRSSCINNRFNIYLNNKKLIDKINIDIFDIFHIKMFINTSLVKSKVFTKNQECYLKSILNTIGTSSLELIYKHFSEFKDLNDTKSKNFTLKFKERLNKL